MKRFVSFAMVIVAMVFAACASDAGASSSAGKESKTLVAYFSAQGHTKSLAEKVALATGGDLFEILPVDPYTEADLDGWNESARGTRESKDRSTRPEVKNKVQNISRYDTIYLGFPIWWFTAPTIVNTFLEQYDTDGKVIIPFATSGGSDMGETVKDLRVSAPKARFIPGRVINNADQKDVDRWVESIKQSSSRE